MFIAMALVCGADPTLEVVNKCPAPVVLVVTNRCPPKAPKSVRRTNGFNCSASFCGANGGAGCPSCPNNFGGTCACGSAPVQAAAPAVTYSIPASQSSCPGGNCPQSTTGYYRPGIFRR